MKKGLTELVFILDRSGSMSGLESDTIGGYNGLIEKQRNLEGEVVVTTVLFDDRYELVQDRVDLKAAALLSEEIYYVRGCTALLDAIGLTIDDIGEKLHALSEDERPEKVLFVITTDGMENASHRYSASQVRGMIEHQKTKYNWEFLFLGANIDAVATARDYGIDADHAVRACSDGRGVRAQFRAVEHAACAARSKGHVSRNWKAEVEADYDARGDKDAPDAPGDSPDAKMRAPISALIKRETGRK